MQSFERATTYVSSFHKGLILLVPLRRTGLDSTDLTSTLEPRRDLPNEDAELEPSPATET